MKARYGILALLILVVAFGLRIAGNNFGAVDAAYNQSFDPFLPNQAGLHPDEYFYVSIPMRMLTEERWNPKFFENPSFLINLNLLTFRLNHVPHPDNTEILGERNYASFPLYFIGRIYSALGGVLAVAAIMGLGRCLSGNWVALASGLMSMLAFPLVQHAHYATTSSLATGFAVLSIWAAVIAYKKPVRWRYWLLAGFAAGFAAGNRYNAAAISIVLFVLGLIVIFRQAGRKISFSILMAYALFPLSFLLTSPFVLLDFSEFWSQFSYIYMSFKSQTNNLSSPLPSLWLSWRYVLVFGLGGLGILPLLYSFRLFLRAWRLKDYFFLGVLGSLWIVISLYSLVVLNNQRPATSDQLAVIIMPLLILLAALGLSAISSSSLRYTLLFGSVFLPAVLCLQWLFLLQNQADTRVLGSTWVYENLPHHARIMLIGGYNLSLDPQDYQVQQIFSTSDIDIQVEDYDYLIVSDAAFFFESRLRILDYDRLIFERLGSITAYPLIFELSRPRWLFDDWTVNNASYWHNPRILVYCMNLELCPNREE